MQFTNKVWNKIGTCCFWLLWPAFYVYLGKSQRTRVIIIVDGKILMVGTWLGSGKWSLPGGGMHAGEKPVAGALREVKEETSIELTAEQLQALGSYEAHEYGFHFTAHLFFVVLPDLPVIKRQLGEVTDHAWLSLDEVSLKTCSKDVVQAIQVWGERQTLLQ